MTPEQWVALALLITKLAQEIQKIKPNIDITDGQMETDEQKLKDAVAELLKDD